MKSLKLFKRMIAFLLIISFVFTGNISTVFAQDNNAEEPGDGTTYFKANFFDYDRDVMNGITLQKIADDITEARYDHQLTSAEISEAYKALLFISSSQLGSAKGYYYFHNEAKNLDFERYFGCSVFNSIENDPFNRNNSGKKKGTSYQGMVKSDLSPEGSPVFDEIYTADLFNVNDNSNKQVYKDTDVQFEVTADGYYLFDSCINKYRYENGKVLIKDKDTTKTGQGFGYVPFGDDDYHFGMNLAIDFYMREDGKYNDNDCVFEFSGDDDVWVYIDGKLALELGGMHYRSDGAIDFANERVIYKNSTNNKGNYCETSRSVSFGSLGISTNDNEIHKMNVFYLERGASESNCKIKFNMPTINTNQDIKGDYTFNKLDSDTQQAISGAEFTLYSDETMSDVVQTAVSDEAGAVTFRDLKTGTYYMKETGVPAGYRESTIKNYKLIVSGNTSESLEFALIDMQTGEPVSAETIYNDPLGNHVEIDKTATLVDWTNRVYEIKLTANVFRQFVENETIATDSNAQPGQLVGGRVIDIIDNRFELTDEAKTFLVNDGAVINDDNSDGTTTITWEVESLLNWERRFTIRAKDSYVGGNNITTNDPASRVIIDGEDEPIPFPQPVVNVRINILAGESDDEIFLGQSLERYFTNEQLNRMYDDSNRDARDVTITYKWKELDDEGQLIDKLGSLEQFSTYIKSLSPEIDTDYYLQIFATPNTGDDSQEALNAAALMNNNDEVLFTASMQVPEDVGEVTYVMVTGIYHVHIIDGKITVNKTYDHSFLTDLIYSTSDIEAIDARQTAVFTVYRYSEDASAEDILNGSAECIESYNITITGNGDQTITGLRAGMYRVVEDTNWTWRYNASLEEGTDGSTDGIFYIGKESPSANLRDSETVSFENNLDRELSRIYADTTNVLNQFLGN